VHLREADSEEEAAGAGRQVAVGHRVEGHRLEAGGVLQPGSLGIPEGEEAGPAATATTGALDRRFRARRA